MEQNESNGTNRNVPWLKEAQDLAKLKEKKLCEMEGHDDEKNLFVKWEKTIRAKGVGDPDATAG